MSKRYVVLTMALIASVVFFGSNTYAQHKGISFQTVIKKPDGTHPTVSGITVTAQILDPVTQCVLREEEHSGKNISNGYLNLTLGDPVASTPSVRNPTPILSIVEVMSNKAARSGLKCVDGANNIISSGHTYTPSSVDRRILRIRMNIQGEDIAADFNMRAVGFAVNSEMLNDKTDSDFVNVNTLKGVVQTNLESVFERFAKLDAILNNFNVGGTSAGIDISGNAATATSATSAINVTGTVAIANGGTGATTVSAARTNLGLGSLATMSPTGTADNTTYLRGDGTWQAVSGGGAVSSVAGRTGAVTLSTSDISGLGALATKTTSGTADNSTYLRGDGAWTALGGAASLNVGTTAGTVAAGNDSRIVGAVQNLGTDGASNVVSISAGLDGSKPGAPTAGQLFIATDAQKVYRYNGSAWITVAQVGGSGFTGSLSGDVSGTQTSTSVDKIKSIPVDTTGLASGKYLKYSGGSWVPAIVGANDLVSSVTGTTQFTTANCADNQTLTWTSLTDSFVCKNISLPSGQVTGLATVATSGSYTDLSNKPTIPAAQVNSDWNSVSGVSQILNKPTLGVLAAKNSVDLSGSEATGVINDARLPASAKYWTAATGGINYAGGRVGIGTTAPNYALTVGDSSTGNGGLWINKQNTSGDEGGEIVLAPGTNGEDSYIFDSYSAGANQILRIRSTTNSNILNLTKAGSVGIGTTNPSAKLDVNGAVNVNGRISGLAAPVAASDAATKAYVDAAMGGTAKDIMHVFHSSNSIPACSAGYTALACQRGSTMTISESTGKFATRNYYQNTAGWGVSTKQNGYEGSSYPYLELLINGARAAEFMMYGAWGYCFCVEN